MHYMQMGKLEHSLLMDLLQPRKHTLQHGGAQARPAGQPQAAARQALRRRQAREEHRAAGWRRGSSRRQPSARSVVQPQRAVIDDRLRQHSNPEAGQGRRTLLLKLLRCMAAASAAAVASSALLHPGDADLDEAQALWALLRLLRLPPLPRGKAQQRPLPRSQPEAGGGDCVTGPGLARRAQQQARLLSGPGQPLPLPAVGDQLQLGGRRSGDLRSRGTDGNLTFPLHVGGSSLECMSMAAQPMHAVR